MADSSLKGEHIGNLALLTWQKLGKVLNERIPGLRGDFKTLGAYLGMKAKELDCIAKQPDPTLYVLWWWGRETNATIQRLYSVLADDMQRPDCVEILIRDPLFADSEKLQRHVERLKKMEEEHKKEEEEHKKREEERKKKEEERKKREEERKKKEEERIKRGGLFLYPVLSAEFLSAEFRLIDLKQDIYDGLCDELNKTAQPSFVTLAGEMGYVRKDILHFKKSSNPADTMLVKWSTNPEHDVPKLIELLKKIRRADLAENLEREVCRIWRTRLVEVLKRMANSVVRLCHLRQPTYDELCHELNRCPQRSLVVLADKMGYVKGEIERFMKSDNPSDAMFQDWEKKSENDVPKLIQLLENAGRVDLAGKLKGEVYIILQERELSETYKTGENSFGQTSAEQHTSCSMSNERFDGMRITPSPEASTSAIRSGCVMNTKRSVQDPGVEGSDEEEKRESEESSDTSDGDAHTACNISNERNYGMHMSRSSGQTSAQERTECRISNERCISLSPKGLKIGQLDPRVHVKLRLELNKSVPGRDYIALAGAMGYNWDDVEIFQLKPDPSNALLCDWKIKPGNDVLGLIKLLREIERDDLAEFLEENTDGRGQLNSGVKRASSINYGCRDLENYGSKKSRK